VLDAAALLIIGELLDFLLDTGDPDDPGDIEPRDLRRFENYAAAALASQP
jgi:hypothetical protein